MAGVLSAVLVVGLAPAASAHATLVRSYPWDNAVLPTAPQELRLWFDEEVAAEFTNTEVLDVDGRPIDLPHPPSEANGLRFVLSLPPLADGVYTVKWEALSQDDGHISRGSIVFRVGAGGAPTGMSRIDPVPPAGVAPGEVLLRWINLTFLIALIGAVAVCVLVLPRRSGIPERHAFRRVIRWGLWCCWLSHAASIGLLLWQSHGLQSTLPAHTSLIVAIGAVVQRTRWGMLWLIRQTLLLALGSNLLSLLRGTRVRPLPDRRVLGLGAALVVGLAITQAMTSHGAALSRQAEVAVLADAAHILSAGAWIGGLIALIVGLLPLIHRGRANSTIIVRSCWRPFTGVAVVSVCILAATGLYSAGRQVASPDASITTLYGQALLSKIGLVLVVGAFGLVNATLLHPAVSAPLARLLRRPRGWTPLGPSGLRATLLIEAGLGVAVLLITGILTSAPPAREALYGPAPTLAPPVLTRTVDDMLVSFSAQPNRPGPNVLTVRALSNRRPAAAPIRGVLLRLTGRGQTKTVSLPMHEVATGEYQAGSEGFAHAGGWSVAVLVQRGGGADRLARFEWAVAPLTPRHRVILSDRPLEPILTRTALGVLMLLALSSALLSFGQIRRRRVAAASVPMLRFGLRMAERGHGRKVLR
jgi:copper transport protein